MDTRQGWLWSYECATCPVSHDCDNALPSAYGCACLCRGQAEALTGDECKHICRERPAAHGSLEEHVAETLSLDEVRIPTRLPSVRRLPAWLPLRTHEVKRRIADVGVAAVELEFLWRSTRDSSAMLRRALPECTTLLAILNANDEILEQFWQAGPEARSEMFHQLRTLGFVGCTGPTFSVWHDTTERLPCHNEISLRRHHRILQEIADAGLVAIPNLYTTGRRSIKHVAAWLNEHPQIELVSRDFTMTRCAKPFASEYQDLYDLMSHVVRPRQVLLSGVSTERAGVVIRGVARLGHSVSLVTGDPILKAIYGIRLSVAADGKMTQAKGVESRTALINGNIDAARQYFEDLRRRVDRGGRHRWPSRARVRAAHPAFGG